MPRPKVWPPKIHVRNGRARIQIDGRDFALGPAGSEEASRRYRELVSRHEAGLPLRPGQGNTVADVLLAWHTYAEKNYDPAGREADQYRYALRPLLDLYGDLSAADFGTEQLEAWLNHVAGLWCRNVCNRRLVRVKTVWRWAERSGLVPKGSWASLCTVPGIPKSSRLARATEPRRGCTWEELDRVAGHAPPAVGAVLRLMWWTGARPGELLQMRPGDVDRSGDVWTYRPDRHKGKHRGQERVIAVGPQAQAVLAPFLDGDPSQPCFRPLACRRDRHGRARMKDRPYTAFSFAQAVRRASAKAGTVLVPYQARHGAKRRLVRLYGLDTARAVLGQTSIHTTDRYDQATDTEAAKTAARAAG